MRTASLLLFFLSGSIYAQFNDGTLGITQNGQLVGTALRAGSNDCEYKEELYFNQNFEYFGGQTSSTLNFKSTTLDNIINDWVEFVQVYVLEYSSNCSNPINSLPQSLANLVKDLK